MTKSCCTLGDKLVDDDSVRCSGSTPDQTASEIASHANTTYCRQNKPDESQGTEGDGGPVGRGGDCRGNEQLTRKRFRTGMYASRSGPSCFAVHQMRSDLPISGISRQSNPNHTSLREQQTVAQQVGGRGESVRNSRVGQMYHARVMQSLSYESSPIVLESSAVSSAYSSARTPPSAITVFSHQAVRRRRIAHKSGDGATLSALTSATEHLVPAVDDRKEQQ